MTVSDEGKKKFILNVLYIAAVIAVIYVVAKYAVVWLLPFIIGFCFAALANYLSGKLLSKIKLPRNFGSVILNIVVLVLLGSAVYLLGFLVYRLISGFVQTFIIDGDIISTLTGALNALAQKLPGELGLSAESIISKLPSLIVTPLTEFLTKTVAGSAPGFLVGFLISIIASFIITADYPDIKAFLVNQFPPKGKKLLGELKVVMKESVFKLVGTYALIMFITFCELFIGLTILKLCGLTELSATLLLAICAITAIIDIIPVFGTGFVLWPWALISAINSQYLFAVGLLVIYVVIQIVRQIIEPKLVGSSLDLHPIVALMSMYIGYLILGAIGIFIFPFCVLIVKSLQDRDYISIYKPLEATPKKRVFKAKTKS